MDSSVINAHRLLRAGYEYVYRPYVEVGRTRDTPTQRYAFDVVIGGKQEGGDVVKAVAELEEEEKKEEEDDDEDGREESENIVFDQIRYVCMYVYMYVCMYVCMYLSQPGPELCFVDRKRLSSSLFLSFTLYIHI